jgi:iron complex transport system substrate-binding protein
LPAAGITCPTVVTLGPSLTELLIGLGAAGQIVGLTRYDDAPQVARVARVGGVLDPDIERIASLHPACVLHVGASGSIEPLLAPLRSLSIRIYHVPVTTLDDLALAAHTLGGLTGHAPRAESFARELARVRSAFGPWAQRCTPFAGQRGLVL